MRTLYWDNHDWARSAGYDNHVLLIKHRLHTMRKHHTHYIEHAGHTVVVCGHVGLHHLTNAPDYRYVTYCDQDPIARGDGLACTCE